MRDIHTSIVSQHLAARDNNKILCTHPPQVSSTEVNLPQHTCRTLAQLRTNTSPFLLSYLHKIDASTHPSPLRPLVAFTNILHHSIGTYKHRAYYTTSPQLSTDTHHAVGPGFVEGTQGVAALLDNWREKLAANPHKATETDSSQQAGRNGYTTTATTSTTDRQTDRQTNRQTDRRTDGRTDKQTDR